MTEIDTKEIERLLHQVANAPTKAAAKADSDRLEFLATSVRGRVNGYAAGKLAQAVISAKAASGRVEHKEREIGRMKTAWYVFRNEIANHDQNT